MARGRGFVALGLAMAFDEALAERIRSAMADHQGVTEKRMFGGIAFLHEGRMFCGIVKDHLMVRVGVEQYEAALAKPHVRPMDFTGRPMKGYVFIGPPGCATVRAVSTWVRSGLAAASSLPVKRATSTRRRSRSA